MKWVSLALVVIGSRSLWSIVCCVASDHAKIALKIGFSLPLVRMGRMAMHTFIP